MNLTERQRDILFAIIEQYAELATPVGSITLAKLFNVSSATVRSEMAKLESYGLIAQPHTSAGRIPTDAGYRFYVNSLVEESEEEFRTDYELPAPAEENLIPDPFIARLTSNSHASQKSSSSNPQNSNLKLSAHTKTSSDRSFHVLEVRVSAQSSMEAQIRGAVDSLAELTGNLSLGTINHQLYLSGIARLFAQPEFSDLSRVRAVAKLLDNLDPWLKEASPGRPLNIFIGNENPIGKTSGVSLIISKFRSPFSDNSYIGVLGPTRQNYQKVMSLVRRAGEMLEKGV